MDTQTVTNWVQIVAGIAVLIGLGLVAYELNQTRELTEAQLLSEGFFAHHSRWSAQMGEQFGLAHSKAWCEPNELTDEEMAVLSSYFRSILIVSVRSLAVARHHGMFDSYDASNFAGQFQEVFLTPYGRYWWSSVSFSYDEEVRDFGNKMLAVLDYSAITCANWRKGYVEYLANE